MPIPLLELARESFFRPRTAAPHLIGLNLSRNVLIEAALLLAVLTILSQFLLYTFIQTQATEVWTVKFSVPLVDVAVQFFNAYLVSQIVVMLARGIRVDVKFSDAMVVYLWFNILLVVLLSLMILTSMLLGPFGIFVVLFTIVWGPYALAVFWSQLMGTKNLFLGFVVAVVAFLIAGAILVIAASFLGLPVMELIPNV
ncbi:hypothetical protein A9Q96_02170 [Rhodobacterales bacterium 52_120_T64]|nr:hypothetical protein A9Q96_02170 [Rhodobacterales bacterium 52_120_T64]